MSLDTLSNKKGKSKLETVPAVIQQEAMDDTRVKMEGWFKSFKETGDIPEELANYDRMFDDSSREGSYEDLVAREEAELTGMIAFFETRDGIEDDHLLKRFGSAIHDSFFSSTAHPGTNMPVGKEFRALLHAGRVPSLQSSLAPALGGDVVYRLSFDEKGNVAKSIENSIRAESPAGRIDALYQLITVAARGSGWGDWSQRGADSARQIVERIAQTEQSPLVRYVAEDVRRRLDQESDNPSIGAIEMTGSEHHGRVSESFSEEEIETTQRILGGITPNMQIFRGGLVPVAKNTIAYLDHSKLPQRLARVPMDKVLEKRTLSGGSLSNLANDLKYIEQKGDFSARRVRELLQIGTTKLVNPRFPDVQLSTNEEVAKAWNEISTALSPEEWNRFWTLNDEISQIEQHTHSHRHDYMAEAGDKNQHASRVFFEEVYSMIPALREAAEHLPPIASEDIDTFEEALESGDDEVIFNAATDIASLSAMLRGDVPEAYGRIAESFDSLRAFHVATWQEAQQLQNQERWAIPADNRYEELAAQHREIVQKLEQSGEKFLADIAAYVDKELKSEANGYVDAHFVPYGKAFDTLTLDPLHTGEKDDSALLLRVLHGPGVRERIEGDFGISFAEMPLRAQFHFLRFITERDAKDTERLKNVIAKFPDAANDIATSFLSLAAGTKYGDRILELAEKLPPEQARSFFALCRETAEQSDDLEVYLTQHFAAPSSEIEPVAATLLTRLGAYIEKNHEALARGDGEELTRLSQQSAGQTLFVSAFKTLRNTQGIQLEDVRGGAFEITPGNSVSPEDIKAILKIQTRHYGEKYPEQMMEELRSGLSEALKSPYSRFYLYRNNGEIVTCVRFDDLAASNDLQHAHMASFMTNPQYEGGALGQALLEPALQKEIENGHSLYAECDPSLVSFYQKFGFRLLRSYKDDYGVDTCDIVLEPELESLREAA